MLTIYGLTKCSTCKKACAWLEENGVEYAFVDYREQPIAADSLLRYATQLGWPKLVNRASMTWRKLPEEAKQPGDDQQWLKLVEQHAALIRRPLAVLDDEVRCGFKPADYQSWLIDSTS